MRRIGFVACLVVIILMCAPALTVMAAEVDRAGSDV